MAVRRQRVVVIQDASRDISLSAIKWAINGLSLKPGDELTLLGVLHQVNTPSTLPFMAAGKLMGYKIKVDSNSMLGANRKIINEELKRKWEEYQNSTEIVSIRDLYGKNKIKFNIRVEPAASPKVVALDAAKKLRATWVILDRQMKKDKKYFLEKLSCGISRMKHNDSVELLRPPKTNKKYAEHTIGNQNLNVTYGEMLPGLEMKPGILEIPDNMLQRPEIKPGFLEIHDEMLPGPEIKPGTSDAILEIHDEMLPGPEIKPGSSDAILEIPDDEELFSLELSPLMLKSQNISSSNAVMAVHSIKGAPEVSAAIPSFSTSTSSDNQSSQNAASTHDHPSPEILSGSSFDGEKHFPFQYQEKQDLISTHRAEENNDSILLNSSHNKIWCTQGNESTIQETEQKSSNISEETLTCGFVDQQLEENQENPLCIYCGNEQIKIEPKRHFTYAELHDATDEFSDENFLSEGGFGYVYKGRLKNRQWIAVKQHKHASSQGEKEFRSEVHVLSKLRHENVVKLLGSCSEGSHRLLVYEYVCNQSLDIHLSRDSPNVLSWKHRMNIALGVAKGLNYLHQNNIIHRDMRPNNILINHEYKPLLGDFGLARTQQNEFDHLSENKVVGTFGYLAPEYAERGWVSSKIDVYSFGVVLLELITGRTPLDKTLQEKSLVGWARPLLEERKYPELIDERIIECHDVHLHQLFCMISVAERCLRKDPDRRPSMDKVEHELECIMNKDGIEDYSPARSSVSSLPKSIDSISEPETETQASTSTDVLSMSSSQTKGLFSTESSEWSTRSQSTSKSSEVSFLGRRNGFKKKKGKSPTRQVLYDEMLD